MKKAFQRRLQNPDDIQRWLRRRARYEASLKLVGAVLFGIAGTATLAVTSLGTGIASVLVLVRVNAVFSLIGADVNVLRPGVLASVLLGVTALCFAGAWRQRQGVDYHDIPKIWLTSPVAGDMLRATARIFCDLLFSGPRLLFIAAEYCGGFARLARLDVTGVSAVIGWLLLRKKATVAQIAAALPGLNMVRILPQLREIPGVIWLVANRGVILLSTELREELAPIIGEPLHEIEGEAWNEDLGDEFAESGGVPAAANEEEIQLYEVLDLPPFAALRDVKRQYRKLAKLYHPDATMNLPPNQRSLAEETMKRINSAYAKIIALHRAGTHKPHAA